MRPAWFAVAARFIAPLLAVATLAPWLALHGPDTRACPTDSVSLAHLNTVIAEARPSIDEPGLHDGIRTASTSETNALRVVMAAFVACSDTGEPLRVLALYTNRYVGELYYRQGSVTANQYAELSRSDPADPDERTRLLAVSDVEVLPDGRIAGEVTIRYAVIPTPKRFVVTIAHVDGAWRIDDILGELTFALP